MIQEYQQKLDARIAELKASGAKTETLAVEFAKHQRRLDEVEAILRRPNGTFGADCNGGARKSLAGALFENAEYKDFVGKGSRGRVRVLLGELPELERKTTITSTAVGSSIPGILVPERVPGIVSGPTPRVRVRDLIPTATTPNNAVEFIRETAFDNQASVVEEASDKPESGISFDIAHEDVQVIAHFIPVSRQIMEDMGALDAYLRVRMIEKLKDVEDGQLLNGSGVGQNLNGLCTQATAVAGTYAHAGDTYIDQVAAAITELEDDGYEPDGVIVHPADWRAMCRVKTEDGGANTGAYVLGGPVGSAALQLWNLPVARTRAMMRGRFLVGQLRRSCMIWDRMAVTVDISDSHSDWFTRNLLCLRVEERLTLTTFDVDGFRLGQFA
jgi:HK97 family phage major capsid protein